MPALLRTAVKDFEALTRQISHDPEALYSEYADSDTVRRLWADGPALPRDGQRQPRTKSFAIEAAIFALVFRDLHSRDAV